MSLSKQQAPDTKKCECDLGFNGENVLSKSNPDLIGNVSDDNIPFIKGEEQLCKSSTPQSLVLFCVYFKDAYN